VGRRLHSLQRSSVVVDGTGAHLNGTGVASKTQSGHQNNNPTSNLTFLNEEISSWNKALNAALPTVGAVA
jgi:hypothetical protein